MVARRGCRPASRKEVWYRKRKNRASMRIWRRHWMNRRFVPEDFSVQECYRCKFKTLKYAKPKVLCCSCLKYLCSDCFDMHKRSPITGRHVFLNAHSPADDNFGDKNKRENVIGNAANVLKGSRFKLEKKVNVRSTDDKYMCWMMGSVLLTHDFIILADYYNICLKIVNISSDEIVARYDLKALPWQPSRPEPLDMCKLPSDRVAVALGCERTIQFFSTKNDLKPDSRLEVSGRCTALDYADEMLGVLYSQPENKIEVMDLRGKILYQVVDSPALDARLFRSPNYLKMATEDGHLMLYYGDHIYVRKMKLSGESIWFRMLGNQIGPRDACLLARDQLLSCGIFSNSVFMVPAQRDGMPLPVLPSNVCVERPTTVTFCKGTRRLLVTCQNAHGAEDYLHVYSAT